MNKVFLLLACMMLLITGCTPKVARRPLTEREQQWEEFVKYYYPAWKPELTVAPAVQPDLVSTPAPQTFTAVEEPLPEMPPTEESELIFGEDSASLDSAVMPENSDVVKYESITAEVTEPVVAEETTTVEAAPAEAKDDKNNTATEENATTVKEEATPAESTAPVAKEDPAAAKEAAPEAKSSEPAAETPVSSGGAASAGASDVSSPLYNPGLYSSPIVLGSQNVNVEVTVSSDQITSVSLVPLSDSIATMYPLMQPAMDSLSEQIVANQSLEGLEYPAGSQYTSMALMNAIKTALNKAVLEQTASTDT